MSELGHTRRIDAPLPSSALPPINGHRRNGSNSPFRPKTRSLEGCVENARRDILRRPARRSRARYTCSVLLAQSFEPWIIVLSPYVAYRARALITTWKQE